MGKKITIVLLIIIAAVVIGWVVGQWSKNKSAQVANVSQSSVKQATSTQDASMAASGPNNDEIIASIPGPGATTAQVESYVAKVATVAKAVTTVDISSCKPQPDVVTIKNNGTLTLTNSDKESHIISYPVNGLILDPGSSASGKITVPAGGSAQLSLTGMIRGIYGFACDPATKKGTQVGLLYITK